MNRFILSILAVLFPLKLLGQMFPLSDHYVFDAQTINIDYAGCHDALIDLHSTGYEYLIKKFIIFDL